MASWGQWRTWRVKRRWYERNHRRSRRFRLNRHAAEGGFFIRHPIEGEVLEALDSGRLEIGETTLLEPALPLAEPPLPAEPPPAPIPPAPAEASAPTGVSVLPGISSVPRMTVPFNARFAGVLRGLFGLVPAACSTPSE